MMTEKLIQFNTKDGLNLPGILFESSKKSRKVALFLHGNGGGSIFAKQDFHFEIADALAKKGIAYFPFDNRGANYIKSFKRIVNGKKVRKNFGMAYELIRDCVSDIDGAVVHLQKLGFKEFFLLGHSTGANKICVYNYYKPKNVFSKFIILGPGDDTGIYYQELGMKKFFETLALCQKKIMGGKGDDLVSRDLIPFTFISYKSLFDTINPEGDYNIFPFIETFKKISLIKKKKAWREYKTLKKPTLAIIGGDDEYAYGDVPKVLEILRDTASPETKFQSVLIPKADHGFWPKERELAKAIAKFL